MQALDVLRALQREPQALNAFLQEVGRARGADHRLDGAIKDLLTELADLDGHRGAGPAARRADGAGAAGFAAGAVGAAGGRRRVLRLTAGRGLGFGVRHAAAQPGPGLGRGAGPAGVADRSSGDTSAPSRGGAAPTRHHPSCCAPERAGHRLRRAVSAPLSVRIDTATRQSCKGLQPLQSCASAHRIGSRQQARCRMDGGGARGLGSGSWGDADGGDHSPARSVTRLAALDADRATRLLHEAREATLAGDRPPVAPRADDRRSPGDRVLRSGVDPEQAARQRAAGDGRDRAPAPHVSALRRGDAGAQRRSGRRSPTPRSRSWSSPTPRAGCCGGEGNAGGAAPGRRHLPRGGRRLGRGRSTGTNAIGTALVARRPGPGALGGALRPQPARLDVRGGPGPRSARRPADRHRRRQRPARPRSIRRRWRWSARWPGSPRARLRTRHLVAVDRLRSVAAPAPAPGWAAGRWRWTRTAGWPRSPGCRRSDRLPLPKSLQAGRVWLPSLGMCRVEPLPGGWLVRVDGRAVGRAAAPGGPRPEPAAGGLTVTVTGRRAAGRPSELSPAPRRAAVRAGRCTARGARRRSWRRTSSATRPAR